ncbi:MAG: hypothetical protein H0W99_10750 [Acidobacteria bacterium]|jgi:hypothetical protein|nr:hypothetical protein [Acidobacteriota bacterium]
MKGSPYVLPSYGGLSLWREKKKGLAATRPNLNRYTTVDDASVNTVPGAQTTTRSSALTFSAPNSNLISISDVEAEAALAQVTLTATCGTKLRGHVPGDDQRVHRIR